MDFESDDMLILEVYYFKFMRLPIFLLCLTKIVICGDYLVLDEQGYDE